MIHSITGFIQIFVFIRRKTIFKRDIPSKFISILMTYICRESNSYYHFQKYVFKLILISYKYELEYAIATNKIWLLQYFWFWFLKIEKHLTSNYEIVIIDEILHTKANSNNILVVMFTLSSVIDCKTAVFLTFRSLVIVMSDRIFIVWCINMFDLVS